MMWHEEYEHEEFGEIIVCWMGKQPDRSHLIAIQCDLWTPAAEVAACIKWARNLHGCETLEGGDGGTAQFQ